MGENRLNETKDENFYDLSQNIVKDFLQTVILIDDEASFELESEGKEKVRKLKKPAKTGKSEEGNVQKKDSDRSTHELNAKSVVDSFASVGITCSILRPKEEEKNLLGNAVEAAKRSDVVIIDWMIHGDNGEKAIEIIKNIIDEDSEKDRLRLIVIYTGETNILKISSEIKSKMKKYLNISEGGDFDDDFTFSYGKLYITVYAKKDVLLPEEYKKRAVSFNDLPDILTKEFSRMTAGLVSNVAIGSISAIRKNTHLLLGRLGQEMDPPYLAHRTLLPCPDYAMLHAVDIVSSEFYSLLQNYEVGKYTDQNMIKAWAKTKEKEGIKFNIKIGNRNVELSSDDLSEIEEKGFAESDWLKSYVDSRYASSEEKAKQKHKDNFEKQAHKDLTKTFCVNEEDPHEVNCKFAILTSIKGHYVHSGYEPTLTLGTIVEDDQNKFWLCIQPRCDSVIIEEKRNFLFLPLKVIDDEKKFNFVILDIKKGFIKLRIDYAAYKIKQINFKVRKSNESTIRTSIDTDKQFYFETADGKKLKWISELKDAQAQRIANTFGSNISRVGLDESEWLRRSSP